MNVYTNDKNQYLKQIGGLADFKSSDLEQWLSKKLVVGLGVFQISIVFKKKESERSKTKQCSKTRVQLGDQQYLTRLCK